MGKPESSFFLAAVAGMTHSPSEPPLSPSECIMIGDDAMDDILGAQTAGIKGILVKTGKYREGDENRMAEESGRRPWRVADDFVHAVQMIHNLIPDWLTPPS